MWRGVRSSSAQMFCTLFPFGTGDYQTHTDTTLNLKEFAKLLYYHPSGDLTRESRLVATLNLASAREQGFTRSTRSYRLCYRIASLATSASESRQRVPAFIRFNARVRDSKQSRAVYKSTESLRTEAEDAAEFRKALAENDNYLLRRILYFSGNIVGSSAYWRQVRVIFGTRIARALLTR